MSTVTTRSVEIPVEGAEPLKVDIRVASETTLELRKKVSKFVKASYKIWKELPEEDTELVATPEVLEEVIHAATAFHCNEQGGVDLIWLKKDMPREALKYPEAAYWKGTAGPAAQTEQLEMRNVRLIPQPVMDYIRRTNDHDFIAHYLYAFIDFWCIVLRHWIIWLGCIFFYGFLCIVQPTIIVGESSKLWNLVVNLRPVDVFRPDIPPEDFQAFLNGIFTLDFLQNLVIITRRKWKDLALEGPDYIHALGSPIIISYGPLPEQVAIYIPKYHPYGGSHIPSVSVPRDLLDREIRYLIERAMVIVKAAGPLPGGTARYDRLVVIRDVIIKDARRHGIMDRIEKLKNEVKQANLAFIGVSTAAVFAATGQSSGQGQNPQAA